MMSLSHADQLSGGKVAFLLLTPGVYQIQRVIVMLITAYKQQRWLNKRANVLWSLQISICQHDSTAVSLFTPIDNTENTNSCALTICRSFNSNVSFFFFFYIKGIKATSVIAFLFGYIVSF